MSWLKKLAVSVTFLCSLQSCTFSLPQAENAFRQIQSFVSEESSVNETQWLASYNGQGAVLYPYVADGYTVFANDSGDAVAFDGWVIRSVLGFGNDDPLSISDEGWDRSSVSSVTRFTATCSEWQREDFNDGFEWCQICGLNGHETVVRVDGTGRITSIRQAFGAALGTIELNLRR